MQQVTWILVIYVLGLTAMMVELFMPEVILGITGFCMVVGSIIFSAVSGHTVLAWVLIGTTVAFLPFFFLLWKNVLGKVFATSETLKDFRSTGMEYEHLLGEDGEAMSSLRPSGTAMIDGTRYNVVTRGEMIDKGAKIQVIDVAGSRLVVKRAGGSGGKTEND